jgi:hypothetical protein
VTGIPVDEPGYAWLGLANITQQSVSLGGFVHNPTSKIRSSNLPKANARFPFISMSLGQSKVGEFSPPATHLNMPLTQGVGVGGVELRG